LPGRNWMARGDGLGSLECWFVVKRIELLAVGLPIGVLHDGVVIVGLGDVRGELFPLGAVTM